MYIKPLFPVFFQPMSAPSHTLWARGTSQILLPWKLPLVGILQGNVASSHRETSCTWTPYIYTLHLLQPPIPAPDIPGKSQLHIANLVYQLPFQVTNLSSFLSVGVKVRNKVSYIMIWHWSWKKKSERFQKFMVFPFFMGCKELNGWADSRKDKLGYSIEWIK